MNGKPEVTICIPAWQAEGFIARTLEAASKQTFSKLKILVSIDASSDRTAEICQNFQESDRRFEVITQPERLGWSKNSNYLLSRVETEFFFLYFHDDVILPDYTEKLLQLLKGSPDAMSAHCDLERFGNQSGIIPGNHYHGSDCRRLINFLVGPVKGTPLRSLTRREVLDRGLRFAEIGTDSFWRCHPFLLRLIASGPALHCPEPLYRRWFRQGSMTEGWSPQSREELLEGQQRNAENCLAIIDGIRASAEEKELVCYCLGLFLLIYTREVELKLGGADLIAPGQISPCLRFDQAPVAISSSEPEIQRWINSAITKLSRLERKCYEAKECNR